MISLGLTAAEQRDFHRVLASSHSVDVRVRILTLNRAYVADVSDQLADGQVNIDANADVTRSLTLSLRDPDHALAFDSKSPNDAALFLDRVINVVYVVSEPYNGATPPKSWSVPIFSGPITKMSRTDEVINLEAQGNESMLIPPVVAWTGKTYAKGVKKTSLIRSLLSEIGGETKFSIPDWPDRTAKPVVIKSTSDIWATAKKVAGSRAVNHLFYDGRGVAVLRKTSGTAQFDFRTGPGGTVLTKPQVNYDASTIRNTVRVTGDTPKKKKTPVKASATAARNHPLSAYALGRNGKRRVLLEEVSDDNAKTTAEARRLAKDTLDRLLLEAVDVTFDAMVIPHLEPEDVCTVKTSTLSMTFRVKQLTIPLKAGNMTVGYLAKRSVAKTRIRRK